MNLCNLETLSKQQELIGMIQHSFLQPWFSYQLFVPSNKSAPNPLDVSAVLVENNLLLFVQASTQQLPPHTSPNRACLEKHQQRLVDAVERLEGAAKIIKSSGKMFVASNLENAIELPKDLRISLICVSRLQIQPNGINMAVEHRFSSEDIKAQNNDKLINYISFSNFKDVLRKCETAYDFIDYFGYYSQCIHLDEAFNSEFELLEKFFDEKHIFTRAVACDKALIAERLADQPNEMLTQTDIYTYAQQLKDIQNDARFWLQELIIGAVRRNNKKEQPQANFNSIVNTLLLENTFSRYTLSKCIIENYSKVLSGEHQQLLLHMRSYCNHNVHYVFVFVGKSEVALAANIDNALKEFIQQVNQGFQYNILDKIVAVALVEQEVTEQNPNKESVSIHMQQMHGYKVQNQTTKQ